MAKSAAAVHDTPMNQTQFHAAFPQLASALLEEWPALQAEPLSATQGDLDKVIGLIVETTGHTKTLVRRQLGEILQIVTAPSESAPGRARSSGMAHDARAAGAAVSDAAHEALTAAGVDVDVRRSSTWSYVVVSVGVLVVLLVHVLVVVLERTFCIE